MIGDKPGTGLSALDHVLKGLLPGDNVVWQIESIDDYREFTAPFCAHAQANRHKVVYFRFAKHEPLFAPGPEVEVCELDPHEGFEGFVAGVRRTLETHGSNTCYVFDCLSDLAADWYSDQMLANFFMLTCPCVLDAKAVAYFAFMRNTHSIHATAPIEQTTQILLDVFRRSDHLYVFPRKTEWRSSPTMFMLHEYDGTSFHPVTLSANISKVMASVPWLQFETGNQRFNVWTRTLREADDALTAILKGEPAGQFDNLFRKLLRMVFSRDRRVLELATGYLDICALAQIARRMIGSGLIGGKSVGMLLARAILVHDDPEWLKVREIHDSFFVGSDVFYTFLVQNGCWWVREKQKSPDTLFEGAAGARQRILSGSFPEYIIQSFKEMLDYYGHSPIIVRSSSLLEDAFGNAFSGKYDSVFCPNQGSREQRLHDFMTAVRRIYASSMSEQALTYRAERNLLASDEQMALLVQRVSGSLRGRYFLPDIAGVGYSFNPYAWNPDIKPEAGMLRVVAGLGTRAVDRSDDDYTRVVSLSVPERRPESSLGQVRQYAQRRIDLLDLDANQLVSRDFATVAAACPGLPLDTLAVKDPELERMASERPSKVFPYVLTFDPLFRDTRFIQDMGRIMDILERAYEYPVDIEFTANHSGNGAFHINLLQCRPLPVRGAVAEVNPPENVPCEKLILRSAGPVIGYSRLMQIDRIISVVPETYSRLTPREQYSIARLVGKLVHIANARPSITTLLMGPGRWGTTTPSLGVPVSFAEISKVAVLCEIVKMRENLVPDVSLGTHFFNDLVERDVLYVGVFPDRPGNVVNDAILERAPNRLETLLPPAANLAGVVRVVDAQDLSPAGKRITLHANTISQTVVCCVGE